MRTITIGALFIVAALCVQACSNGGRELEVWHTVELDEEFTADMAGQQVRNFEDYLELEERLFQELEDEVYAVTPTGPAHILERYSRGSAADPGNSQPNWNRSYELPADNPVGGVLLLHGLSDSPYSLRTLGKTLNENGYWVIGLRLPGHGTAPSGLVHMRWQDMAAAVKLAADHLLAKMGTRPVHLVGYSTGAPLAMDFILGALAGEDTAVPASLVLISPAIRVHPASALAGFKDTMAMLPGLGGWAYLNLINEFDPYKYNSFASNAGAQVHGITRNVDRRIQRLAANPAAAGKFPPVLVLKSTVDSTVTTEAVVDNLLLKLPGGRNELVLFDINRNAAIASIMVSDPGPLTRRLLDDDKLPFSVTFVTNEDPGSPGVIARHKAPFSSGISDQEELELAWPRGIVSLSHVALPIPPDDLLYGQVQNENNDMIFLGDLAFRGERGLLKVPGDWLLRLRYNPFYEYMQTRILQWMDGENQPNGLAK
jgi:alpha-beta hydrolase superfamily lysophospholipase